MNNQVPRVAVSGIDKRFGATQALLGASVDVLPGEVHSLVGENGAGKSTLGKIIVGVHQPDAGSIQIDGAQASFFHNPNQAAGHGFVGVAQELALIPALTVTQNVVLGDEPGRAGFLDDRTARRTVIDLASEHGFELDVDRPVGELTIADQQKVELLRALSRSLQLVVFDEPTARLASHEALELRRTVRQLADKGVAVVYISHFLDEVLAISDRITTMRDGQVVRTSAAADETRESLVEAMTGRSMSSMFPALSPAPTADTEVILDVAGISHPGLFDDISFQVRAGEIVGFAGLVGAGRSDVAMAVYGATSIAAGTVTIAGDTSTKRSVAQAIESGIALIPESRRGQGLLMDRSVEENTTLPMLGRFTSLFTLKSRALMKAARTATDEASVKSESLGAPVASLSGGNQQKVLFARAMMAKPRVLVADEPTRGVDVGAKEGIYTLISELAADGCAVMLVSSELEEILGLCHRVLVMRSGRIVAELSGADLNESTILAAAFGSQDDSDPADAGPTDIELHETHPAEPGPTSPDTTPTADSPEEPS